MRLKSAGVVANSAENSMMKKRLGCFASNYAYTIISEAAVEISTRSLVFKVDHNRDGDVAYTGEKNAFGHDQDTKILS